MFVGSLSVLENNTRLGWKLQTLLLQLRTFLIQTLLFPNVLYGSHHKNSYWQFLLAI